MYESPFLTPDDEFEARLRGVRPASPRLDRDRLMYLAGQRSVAPTRNNRPLWPALAVASWAACAVLVGLAFARPPRVVTETKIVERVVEVPVAAVEPESVSGDAPAATADAAPALPTDLEPPFTFAFLDNLQQPLTALASRPELFENLAPPVTVARTDPTPVAAEAREPQTYGKLRRELLDDEDRASDPAQRSRWF